MGKHENIFNTKATLNAVLKRSSMEQLYIMQMAVDILINKFNIPKTRVAAAIIVAYERFLEEEKELGREGDEDTRNDKV